MFKSYAAARIEETKNGGMKFNPAKIPNHSDIPYSKNLIQTGPYWIDSIHNHDFIKRVQKRKDAL